MTTQNYLMINESTNVVENNVVWDGNTETWQPPTGYLLLPDATTIGRIWIAVFEGEKIIDYVYEDREGAADIGFIWNGTACITPESKPQIPTPLPTT